MAKASASIEIPASPDAVWQLIGGFDALPDWLPAVPKSELSEGGRVRTLTTPSGEAIVEQLMSYDHNDRSYSYTILKAPFPVTGYLSTLRVREAGAGGSRVEWFGEFTPNPGVSDAKAISIFQTLYEGGLKALADGMAARKQ